MTLGRTRGSSRRNTSIASRSPAQRLANAAGASCRLRERQERCLRLEAAVPADAGPFELLRSLLGEEVEVVERGPERRLAELPERHFGAPEVVLLDRAGEPAVCRPLARHRRKRGPAS